MRRSTRGMRWAKSLSGEQFGHWLVLERFEYNTPQNKPVWWCRCDCGTEAPVIGSHLKGGLSTNCGCVRSMKMALYNTTHGLTTVSEFQVWCGMRARCSDPNHKGWKYYGGRGITVCERWLNSFAAFYEDMGPRPTAMHSIDRRDNNDNYEPDNCRWATALEQAANKRPRA